MKWLTQYLTSSIGRKMTMSLTGLFLILFLIVHLLGNLQLLHDDQGKAFNLYAHFLTHFLPVTIISYGLYAFIVLHAIQGLLLWSENRQAKGKKYAITPKVPGISWSAKQMALLGTLILAFILIHMGDFWWKMHNHLLTQASYDNGESVNNLYERVSAAFQVPWIVAVYVIGQLALSFHLWHGFQSAFQTLGVNHPKYTPLIQALGKGYSIIVPALFAYLPIWFYFKNN